MECLWFFSSPFRVGEKEKNKSKGMNADFWVGVLVVG
jgi:hypothetical protein